MGATRPRGREWTMADHDDVQHEVLNMRQFEDATGGDVELMQELAGLYLADADAQMPGLEEAVVQRDMERVSRVAHGLKGSSASIGADRVANVFKIIEAMGRDGTEDGLDDAVAAARDAYVVVRERLTRMAA